MLYMTTVTVKLKLIQYTHFCLGYAVKQATTETSL